MKKIVLAILLTLSVFLVACSNVPEEKQCTQDTDCVPAECCHPTSAVNKQYAPDCTGSICTLECKEGTLDCAQGEVKCIQGACKAIING